MAATDLFDRAKKIYEERLQSKLEQTHLNFFVAIEPESGDYFLGRTLSEAAAAARAAHPDRRSGVLRVGYRATLHIGAIEHVHAQSALKMEHVEVVCSGRHFPRTWTR